MLAGCFVCEQSEHRLFFKHVSDLCTRTALSTTDPMKRILCSDWLPDRARWILAIQYNKSFIDQACSVKMAGYWSFYYYFFFAFLWTSTSPPSINPLLTKLVRSRWLDIGLVIINFLFCVLMDLILVSVHKNAKSSHLDRTGLMSNVYLWFMAQCHKIVIMFISQIYLRTFRIANS